MFKCRLRVKVISVFFLLIKEISLSSWITKGLSPCHKLKILIPTTLQPDGVNLWYFILKFFNLTEYIVWNI